MRVLFQNVVVVVALLLILASEALSKTVERWRSAYHARTDPKK